MRSFNTRTAINCSIFLTANAPLNFISNRICSWNKSMHHKHSSLQFHTRLVSPIYCNFEKFFHYLTIFRCLNVRKSQFLHKHLIANKGTFSYSFLSWTQTNKTFCRTNALHEPNAILTLTRCHYIIKNQLKYFITLKSKVIQNMK